MSEVMLDKEAIVLRFLDDWSRFDVDALTGYFTEDAVYWNVPLEPLVGKEAISRDAGRVDRGRRPRLPVRDDAFRHVGRRRLQRAHRLLHDNDTKVALPVAAVFELEDGKRSEPGETTST